MIGAIMGAIIIFPCILISALTLFRPSGDTAIRNMHVEIPEGPFRRIAAVVATLGLAYTGILLIRQARIAHRIHCSDGLLAYSWPRLSKMGLLELRWNQIKQIYGGEDDFNDGKTYYVGVVDSDGNEHRLLFLQEISRKDAIYLGGVLRATIGLPKTEQDDPNFDKW